MKKLLYFDESTFNDDVQNCETICEIVNGTLAANNYSLKDTTFKDIISNSLADKVFKQAQKDII